MAGKAISGLGRVFKGLLCMALVCVPALASALDCSLSSDGRFFPETDLFQPLLADPKEPHFFFSYRSYARSAGKQHVGVVGFGETFGLYRRVRGCGEDGWQMDIAGGGVARFDLEDGENDMIDVDYQIGLPLSWRRGDWSVRTRVYHESSHRGESVLNNSDTVVPQRKKRSINSVDVISSHTWKGWRLYSGAGYVLSHYPEIEPWLAHLGAEYYSNRIPLGDAVYWVAGVDIKAWEEFDYEADVSFKTGLSLGGPDARQHDLQVLLEWYDGHADSGVFFEEEIRYFGASIYFGF